MSQTQNTPVTSIRNIGPAMEQTLRRIGITSAEELRSLGADATYARMLESGSRPHFIAYYALVMALQGRPWNDCKGKEKSDLRVKFGALVSGGHDKGRSDLEAALNIIGVIERP